MYIGIFQTIVIAVLVIQLFFAADVYNRILLSRLSTANENLRASVDAMRQMLEDPAEAESQTDMKECAMKDISLLSYADWYRGSLFQLGNFEPYVAIMNLDKVQKKVDFNAPFGTPGVDYAPVSGRQRLAACAKYRSELNILFEEKRIEANLSSPLGVSSLAPLDAALLYCMVRADKPQRIEVVGGDSAVTLVKEALLRNSAEPGFGRPVVHISDVSPSIAVVHALHELSPVGVVVTVSLQSAEDVAIESFEETFGSLKANDMLIVSSPKVFRIDNEVHCILTNIIPRLAAGVSIMYRDIYLPRHYRPAIVLEKHWFWTEQYFLLALLSQSSSAIKIEVAMHYLYSVVPSHGTAAGNNSIYGVFEAFGTAAAVQSSMFAKHAKQSNGLVLAEPSALVLRKVKVATEYDDVDLKNGDAGEHLWRPIDSWRHPSPIGQRSKYQYAF